MRKKQDILDSVINAMEDTPEGLNFQQKISFLEVLIDIRDLLEDIKWKK